MQAHPSHEDTALVVFSGQTDLRWLKCLKPGFRHCFVLIRSRDSWISIDPMAHMTRIDLHDLQPGQNLQEVLQEHGLTVIGTYLRDAPKVVAVPMLCSCVEIVKRILGIQAWRIVTPWQLYRYLAHAAR